MDEKILEEFKADIGKLIAEYVTMNVSMKGNHATVGIGLINALVKKYEITKKVEIVKP